MVIIAFKKSPVEVWIVDEYVGERKERRIGINCRVCNH